MHRNPLPPAVGQRPRVVVGGADPVQVRHAAEECELREVGLPVSAVRRGVDQPGPVVGAPQDVARPEVTVNPGRRFVAAEGGSPDEDLFDKLSLGRAERAIVDRHPQVRHEPALDEPP